MKKKVSSKLRLAWLLSLLLCGCLSAQELLLPLSRGNALRFHNQLFAFGLDGAKDKAQLRVYRLDPKLNKTDSFTKEIGGLREHYLQLWADTLHDFLNIYAQQKDKKSVNIYRFGRSMEPVTSVENVEVARLNNASMFGGKPFYHRNSVYAVRIQSDTAGRQFYLNKYDLKTGTKNFDYELKWQFAFERKNVHSAHIFYAGSSQVLLYVTVSEGPKTGQWLLMLSPQNGRLIRGVKLNDKGEGNYYAFGAFRVDASDKSIQLAGQKFTDAQFSEKDNKLAIFNAAQASLYFMAIDSLGEVSARQEFKIPVNDIKSGAAKGKNAYLLRFNKLNKNNDLSFSLEADVYKSSGNPLCYLYCNTLSLKLNPGEDKLSLEKTAIATNLMIEQFYFTADKLDMNGKLCTDSLAQFDQLFHKILPLNVKLDFKTDAENNPQWLLSKSNLKKNSIEYTRLMPEKKIYQLKTLEDLPKTAAPAFTGWPGAFIISSQPDEKIYRLKIFNW